MEDQKRDESDAAADDLDDLDLEPDEADDVKGGTARGGGGGTRPLGGGGLGG